MQTIIPTAISNKGKKSTERYWLHYVPIAIEPLYPTSVSEEITKAAHVDSANDPNKSALIPATSPTLSPTLSAIVAGFLGLSSGRSFSTFPTKSAPTSAAFV
jgi:hypothetical protein